MVYNSAKRVLCYWKAELVWQDNGEIEATSTIISVPAVDYSYYLSNQEVLHTFGSALVLTMEDHEDHVRTICSFHNFFSQLFCMPAMYYFVNIPKGVCLPTGLLSPAACGYLCGLDDDINIQVIVRPGDVSVCFLLRCLHTTYIILCV